MTATIPNLPSQYDSAASEAKWQKFWEENQVFKADPNAPGEPYCVVIPPPNVTGSLHMGHAFETALIDALVRYHRMCGYNTLWLPGTDHASIAVQTILEKQLKAEGKTRQELGREAFLDRAWKWKAESGGTIVNQLRRLGVSVDWSRERFTMDEGLSKAVLEAFIKLYDENLIYRGNYLVNWCPASQSAVSDLEVENQEVNGHLWHFRYPLVQSDGYVEVATTRPETMLGDTAVAVNPKDDRYKHLIGQTVLLPLMEREIPIIGDEFVDPAFGTGCVKVTPAHDLNDFEMGKRNNLKFINILNKDGTINENGGEFQGQDRFVARKNVIKRLEEEGLLGEIEDYKHTVPYSDRGRVPIEPLLSTQWFVKIKPLSEPALADLDQKHSPDFVPDRWGKVYRDWLVNLKDWCISRQLWWGHQIPAWYAVSETGGVLTDTTPFMVARSEAEAREKAIALFGENVQLEQDPDVLDTWFSAGLWPFSTLGWPDKTPDFKRYYPTATLVTGFDIIFFWVARMTMMAKHFTGEMPFKTVYIHGLVRDENNKKMSKSSNNGIDPLILIDKYGTDALRYTLVREVTGAGQDIRLEYNRKTDESVSVEASRNFTNKLWNASRFVLMNLDGKTPEQLGFPDKSKLELSDRWILSRFHQVTQQIRDQVDHYGLGESAKLLYEFIWGDFCDWYIELVKPRLQGNDTASRQVAQQTLAYVLEETLKLLHPFMPHITEEIWHTVTQNDENSGKTLALQTYPVPDSTLINPDLEQQFELLIGTIRTIRNLRAEADIKPGVKIQAILQTESEQEEHILKSGQPYIQDLAKVKTLRINHPQTQSILESAENLSEADLLSSIATFLSKHQRVLLTIGFILLTLIVLKACAGVLGAVHEIPLLPTFLELVGIGYTTRFTQQKLWKVDDRQQLFDQIEQFKTEVVGSRPDDLEPVFDVPPSVIEDSAQTIVGVVGTVRVAIPLAGLIDLVALKAKTEKDLKKVEAEIQSLSGRLSNAKFVDKAPADVVQTARDALAEAEKQAEILQTRLDRLG
ncbi:valine--tRNA ligase [Phormidesmis priestleyi ULC007]|uniref:Valine--tRNA ligase n=1 Tax=Phormidesmis priestleyi ULC007 TaxID=1920490 RepID=A0A2T1DF65_9CYAN|nr:valine--tRNA ligase [Phormidesmis priestleyi]PSB19094.1 valine--tRNA ligase [Phormidesmis priestleyi ULC007]PZO49946.1 MAG: valine--tRNA ligase [Phormidesmis priestleyi]